MITKNVIIFIKLLYNLKNCLNIRFFKNVLYMNAK